MATVARAREERQAALARLDVFSALSDAEQSVVSKVARLRRYEKGRAVVAQGAVTDAAFGVVTGRLRVSLSRANGSGESTLTILGPGELFGELGLFQDGSRSARVTALEDARVLAISKPVFLSVLERSAAGSLALCRLLASRVRQLAQHLDEVTAMPVEQRLARKLVLLVERWGEPARGGLGIGLKLSQQELADLADTTRQTVNQCLARWRKAGIVASGTGRLVVSDLRRLEQCASGMGS
jgi:CRP/FNR family transcriptional regulator, cyclic AMP receptor protein